MDDVRWWKHDSTQQFEHPKGHEVPGDTDGADIVSRTGEEMPEVAHDEGQDDDDGINPIDVDSMPRAEDDPITQKRSPEFHDYPGVKDGRPNPPAPRRS